MLTSWTQTPKSGNCILLANEPLPLGFCSLSESFFGERDISMCEASLCSLHLGMATELLPLSHQHPVLEKGRGQAQDTGAFKAAVFGRQREELFIQRHLERPLLLRDVGLWGSLWATSPWRWPSRQ